MTVTTVITRKDIARLNLWALFHFKSNAIGVALLAVLALIAIEWWSSPATLFDWSIAVLSASLAGIMGVLGGFLLSTFWVLTVSSDKTGVLGEHTYILIEEGLCEQTPVNESFHKWSGIESVNRIRNYIFIQINGYLFHIVPRRAFAGDAEFDAFWQQAQLSWAKYHSATDET